MVSQMEDFVYARNFRERLVYKQAFIVSRRIFELSKGEDSPLVEGIDSQDPLTPDW
jgi:hypothetical protein